MMHRLQKLDWFRVGGGILAVWAFLNTYLDITRYGIEQGFYWWFCNLALIGAAGGLLFKHRGWLTGFLSIACFTQVFWVIDNQYRLFTGENLFGLVEFMYQPGLPIDEFILSHYHYFTIPISLLALFYLPRKKSNALFLIFIFNPLIFGVSYFVFPKVQNVNCIHEPCFPSLQHWAGPTYSFFFWFCIFIVHLVIGYCIENFFVKTRIRAVHRRIALRTFGVLTTIAIALATWDTAYKMNLPSLQCLNAEPSESVQLQCRYTLDYSPNVMLFNYRTENKGLSEKICTTGMRIEGEESLMDSNLVLKPNEVKKLSVLLPYPKESTKAELFVRCESVSERANASQGVEPQ